MFVRSALLRSGGDKHGLGLGLAGDGSVKENKRTLGRRRGMGGKRAEKASQTCPQPRGVRFEGGSWSHVIEPGTRRCKRYESTIGDLDAPYTCTIGPRTRKSLHKLAVGC